MLLYKNKAKLLQPGLFPPFAKEMRQQKRHKNMFFFSISNVRGLHITYKNIVKCRPFC